MDINKNSPLIFHLFDGRRPVPNCTTKLKVIYDEVKLQCTRLASEMTCFDQTCIRLYWHKTCSSRDQLPCRRKALILKIIIYMASRGQEEVDSVVTAGSRPWTCGNNAAVVFRLHVVSRDDGKATSCCEFLWRGLGDGCLVIRSTPCPMR